MDFGRMRILCNLVFIITAFGPLVDAECTSGVELLVNGTSWPSSDIPLYKPLGSNGTFVRCQRCSGSGKPEWFNSNNETVRFCDETMPQICVNRAKTRFSNLNFSNFTLLQEGNYTCKHKNEMDAIVIMISALSLKPINQLISINMTAKPLNCKTTSRRSIAYQWEARNINGGQWIIISNSDNRRLMLKNLQQSQQYRCVVSNEAGSTRSNVATVTVLSPPTIMIHPANKLTNSSTSITLYCQENGTGSISYQWESRRINSGEWMIISNSNSRILTVKNPKQSQQYRCVVSNEVGSTRSNVATVTVLKINIQPRNSTIVALKDVKLQCIASTDGVKYSWHRINGNLPDGSKGQNNFRLTIVKATPNDRGMYYCMASKGNISVKSMRAILNVNDVFSIKISSNVETVIKNELIADERSTVNFTATVNSKYNNSFAYRWHKRGRDGLPNKASGFNEPVLVIPNALKSDEGKYYCNVRNEWARTIRSEDVTLKVTAGLIKFWRHPVDQIINNSQAVTFECFVNGSKTTSVMWEKDGRQYSTKNKNWVELLNNKGSYKLIFSSTTVNDGGKYRCTATNGDGYSAVSDEAELIIRPQIIINPNSATVLIGQSAQLLCEALGTNLVYQWMKDSVILSGANSRILIINSTDQADEGVYKCMATNTGGMVESNPATITVYDSPMIEDLPQQIHVVLGEQLEITCTATNDQDAPKNLMFSWRTPQNVNRTTNEDSGSQKATSTLLINAVTRDHGGVYQCIVRNGEPLSANSSKATTLIVEVRSSPPLAFNITYTDVTSFQLTWKEPEYPNGKIDYYNVYYINGSGNHSKQVPNDTDFAGAYTLDNLRPYTLYHVYVTAVRLIGDTNRSLEGMKSETVIRRTLAGEPVISDEASQTESEEIINYDSFVASSETYIIDLPVINTMINGPFSHLYIIVVVNHTVINDAKTVTTEELLFHTRNSSLLFYITAVVNASQYRDGYDMKYALGAGDSTTDMNGYVFHNRKVDGSYFVFFRVFSANSTLQNEISSTTEIKPIRSSQQSTGGSSSGSAAGPVAGVIVALLFIIIVIIIIILLLFYYKKKHLEPKKAAFSNVVPTTDVQLNNKEMKDEDAKPLPPVAATKPYSQETSFTPKSPLAMEVTTSVGQPTTLFIELPYADDSEITWKKDGKSVSHPVLPDGSLYIANTKLTDQGDYTVTAAATDSTTSESLKLMVLDPKMPTTLSDHKPVKVENFPEHIALMQSNKSIQFEEDYESVMVDVKTSQHAAKLHVNGSKNRYKNIIPYDHSRVVLTQQGEKPGSDYVNASFVDGYKEPKAYIASQGPVSNTVDDFWRMIWECNVATIVMLTRLVEDSKIKCHQYWPQSKSAVYGNFKVTVAEDEVIAKYCIRKFIIEKTSDNKSREVCQFHYTAWPDHGVPKYGTDILEFQKRIDKYHKRKDNKPMLVHCSAGVGRSGTFIAIDTEIQRINHENLVDVFNSVCRLRFWRNFMVQTVDQYTLIFTALLEYISCGDTSIAAPTNSVQGKVKELSTVDPSTKKTGFETQFETLTKNSPKDKEFTYTFATSSKNKSKNRNKKCIPPDSSRVCLSKARSESDYINACYIDGYRRCKEFLVGPGPMESTSADFWRMIWENQSHAIVMLGQLKENGEEASWQYWPDKDDQCEFDNLTIQTTSEDAVDNNIIKRVMKITHKETSATKTITQLQYVEWSQNVIPSNANSIVDLIETLERVQRKTGNGPITVHCSDGMGRSGTFCALMVSINRFKAEQMVDVFKTVITMRTQRPGLVANAEQYKFIHEAIVTMLQRFANYCNFSNDNVTTSAVYENLPTSSS